MEVLVDEKIVSETTDKRRNRVYRFDRYLDILDERTEPHMSPDVSGHPVAGVISVFLETQCR